MVKWCVGGAYVGCKWGVDGVRGAENNEKVGESGVSRGESGVRYWYDISKMLVW